MSDPQSSMLVILQNTFVLADLHRRVDLLQQFLEHSFFTDDPQKKDPVRSIRAYYAEADEDIRQHVEAITAWGPDFFASFNARDLYEKVKEFKQFIELLPRITLYVPVRLAPSRAGSIGSWCRTNIRKDLILDLKVDPAVVGGCAFAYEHAFHDLSLPYFLRQKRDDFAKLVRTYAA